MRNGTFTARILQGGRADRRYTSTELATYVDVLRQPANARATQQYYRQFLLHELRPLVSGAFHARPLQTETRLLWGRRDPIVRGAHDDEHLPYAPNMTIEWVDGAGHFLPEERPDLVVARARELFGAAPAQAAPAADA
jgi:pimeloyl-ACP methyl ester carboxylesterase